PSGPWPLVGASSGGINAQLIPAGGLRAIIRGVRRVEGGRTTPETGMSIVIRDVREHELDSVLALNNAAGPNILPLDAARVRFFFEHAEYFKVGEVNGHLAGFLIALSHQAPHDSANFRWFRDRYPEFLYIDRIVIAS